MENNRYRSIKEYIAQLETAQTVEELKKVREEFFEMAYVGQWAALSTWIRKFLWLPKCLIAPFCCEILEAFMSLGTGFKGYGLSLWQALNGKSLRLRESRKVKDT